MSASTGRFGGARAKYHLCPTFVFLNMYPINRSEVMLVHADKNVDENCKLTNEDTRKLEKMLLTELVKLTKRLKENLQIL
jgi:chromate reductase